MATLVDNKIGMFCHVEFVQFKHYSILKRKLIGHLFLPDMSFDLCMQIQ